MPPYVAILSSLIGKRHQNGAYQWRLLQPHATHDQVAPLANSVLILKKLLLSLPTTSKAFSAPLICFLMLAVCSFKHGSSQHTLRLYNLHNKFASFLGSTVDEYFYCVELPGPRAFLFHRNAFTSFPHFEVLNMPDSLLLRFRITNNKQLYLTDLWERDRPERIRLMDTVLVIRRAELTQQDYELRKGLINGRVAISLVPLPGTISPKRVARSRLVYRYDAATQQGTAFGRRREQHSLDNWCQLDNSSSENGWYRLLSDSWLLR